MTLQSTAFARLGVGLAQGIALYLLQQAAEAKSWPATDGLIFAPLLTVAIFVPIIVVAGLGNMRPRTLAGWAIAATVLCAGLAAYNIFRDQTSDLTRVVPTAALWLPLAAILFIIHSLIASGEADRRFIASIRYISTYPGSKAFSLASPPALSPSSGRRCGSAPSFFGSSKLNFLLISSNAHGSRSRRRPWSLPTRFT